MELVDGQSLARLLAAGPLGPARAMGIVAQAATGLQAAHAAGLVHRDIKPGNLLVGRDDQVKITDFGIAQIAGAARLTRTGTLVGTAAYLAPERATGGPATPASDLYSLGVVAYECPTGEAPFDGDPLAVALAHLQQAMPPPPPSVPAPSTASTAPWNTRSRWRQRQNPAHTASGRSVGTTGAGRSVVPIR
jgi:eukaryotic-like serine/threonine-protein kinase